jgi:hypothetical protein
VRREEDAGKDSVHLEDGKTSEKLNEGTNLHLHYIHTYVIYMEMRLTRMSYIDPKTVLSPRGSVSNVEVVFNTGPVGNSWSVARLLWENEPAVGIRWNGEDGTERGVGTPQARGNPTWFIVPAELAKSVLSHAEELAQKTNQSLESAYRDMAADREREAEAQEWCEGLIANASQQR